MLILICSDLQTLNTGDLSGEERSCCDRVPRRVRVFVGSRGKPCCVTRLGLRAGGWQAAIAGRDSCRAGREIGYRAETAARINTPRGLASSTGQGKPIFKPLWTDSRAWDMGGAEKCGGRGRWEGESSREQHGAVLGVSTGSTNSSAVLCAGSSALHKGTIRHWAVSEDARSDLECAE